MASLDHSPVDFIGDFMLTVPACVFGGGQCRVQTTIRNVTTDYIS